MSLEGQKYSPPAKGFRIHIAANPEHGVHYGRFSKCWEVLSSLLGEMKSFSFALLPGSLLLRRLPRRHPSVNLRPTVGRARF